MRLAFHRPRLLLGSAGLLLCSASIGQPQALRGLTATTPVRAEALACGATIPAPQKLPPTNSGPFVYLLVPCLPGTAAPVAAQIALIEEYLRDIQLRPSRPSLDEWIPYDAALERTIFEDFQRLWARHRLADLSIDVRDYQFANGAIGKVVVYNITERK